ncbi:MAG: nitrogen regulation protein NR(II) [Gammaproteobacteria bacterium]|nr:MAG: nitrogen regulation protein NR(II) [Gammaproteobacteria bacterium]
MVPSVNNSPFSADMILNNVSVAVLALTADMQVKYMNSSAEELLGISVKQALNSSLDRILIGDELLERFISRSYAMGQSHVEHGLQILTHSGRETTISCIVTPIPHKEFKYFLLVEMFQIGRQMKITRDDTLLAQQDATRMLVRGLAHEIKNPLGGIRGAAQLLESELPDTAMHEYTQVIIGEADRLQVLMDRMLGPNHAPKDEVLNVHEILERIRILIRAEAASSVELKRNYDPSIPDMMADEDYLHQAILNIARNALQAVGTEGTIEFKTRIERNLQLKNKRHKLAAKIMIIDSGPGIAVDLKEKIFFPMITGHANGTGLGLPIAQSLIQRQGGLIEFESEPGETIFTISIPLESEL